MKVTKLKAIPIEPSEFDSLEELIRKMFREEIYLPLLKELEVPKKALTNSIEDLQDAIVKGQITHANGKFTGTFNAQISRELRKLGAKWEKGGYRIRLSSLPMDIRNAIAAGETRFARVLRKIDERLKKILPSQITDKVKMTKLFDSTLWKTDQSVKSSLKAITVPPQLTTERRAKIAEEYTENMDKYIQEWSEEQIIKLRKEVQRKVFKGNRYESMVDTIQKSYDVSKRKAKFLARQETNLLMTKFKESLYTDSGVHEYIWQCVHNPKDSSPKQHVKGNVRYYHGLLDKTVQRWDKPPVTDSIGSRNNPGEDYNCRCVARPIVRF